jgi:hypothetical protein
MRVSKHSGENFTQSFQFNSTAKNNKMTEKLLSCYRITYIKITLSKIKFINNNKKFKEINP